MNPEAFKPLIKSPLKFPVKSPLKSALRLPLGASTESSLKSPLAVQGIISNIVEDSARSYYPHFEGTKYNMYVDCRGNVTIGNGFFLDRAMAMTLRFKRPDGSYIKHKNQAKPDEPDETGEIGRDYDAVRTGHEGTLTIDGSTVIKLFEESIAKATNGARTRFPLYDTFPADARLAIHSYIFATGHLDPIIPNTKKKGEPYLHAAIMRQDWWSASAEVHMADETRGNPGLRPRNDANRRAFAYAGRVVHWNYDSKQLYLTVDPEWGATAKNTAVNANFLYLMAKGGNMIIYGWDTDAVGTQSPDVYNLGSLASRIRAPLAVAAMATVAIL